MTWKKYAFWILLTEAVGGISSWLTRTGMEAYKTSVVKPDFAPPDIVFPIAWTILFAIMGIGAARVYMAQPSQERSRALKIYFLQLAVNFLWSVIFFNLQSFGFAFIWLILLWILILFMILSFRSVDKTAAYLQIPYLLWATFAAFLNYSVWILNR